ncbi:MAG TPA: helix-turn-helix domain-containing protein [Stellaceae bacterium]|nr:helix-turn-helix domain-containing protein [Stellaceae bacterium]
MNTLLDKPGTIVPSKEDAEMATEASRILATSRTEGEFRVQLDNGQVLILPYAVERLLSHILTEMSHGNAVSIIPIHAELTTQEAAEYLNVSRPYLIGLLEQGKIKFHRVGTHRRIRFLDIKEYKEEIDRQRDAALDELAEQAQELDMGY